MYAFKLIECSTGSQEKLNAAKEFLGEKYVFHPKNKINKISLAENDVKSLRSLIDRAASFEIRASTDMKEVQIKLRFGE